MTKHQKILLLVALFVIALGTLIRVLLGKDNTTFYTITTISAHIALVLIGTTFARNGSFKRTRSDD